MRLIQLKRCLLFVIIPGLVLSVLAAVSMFDMGQAAAVGAGLERHLKAGLNCQSCHAESPPKEMVPGMKCMTCHGDLAKLVQKSSKAVPNPHASPHLSPGETPKCEECHHIHKPSEVSCLKCHEDFKLKTP